MLKDTPISIIIRTLNEAVYLRSCLESINRQSLAANVSVIIVDSGSLDSTIEIAEQFSCLIIKIPKHEFTYGYALNKGIEAAHSKIIVSISAHCIPEGVDWLRNLVQPILSGNCQLTSGRQKSDPSARSSEVNYFREKNSGNGICAFNNANSAFLKSLWKERQFDEMLVAQEDVDFAQFHVSKGSVFSFCDDATVIHFHNFTNKQIYHKLKHELTAEILIGAKTYGDLIKNLFYHPVRIHNDIRLALHRRKLIEASPGIIYFRLIEALVYLQLVFFVSLGKIFK